MKPLEGVRVLDVSRVVSGPTCAFALAALGAEVLRIESPGGDVTWRSPPFVGPEGVHRGERGPRDIPLSPLRRGRSKRSLVIDLKQEAGRDLLIRLAEKSDVLLENFTPGVTESLGIDYASLEDRCPRLVYCSITGYGYSGPYRDRPSMDLVVQAMSGLMAKTGFPDGPPTKVGVTIGDQVPGLYAALAIVAALRQRDLEDRGQWVDVAMLDALVALLWDEPLDEFEAQGVPERVGNTDPRGAPLDVFACADGWVAIVCGGEAQWQRMTEQMHRPDLWERFPSLRARLANKDAIQEATAKWCRTRTADAIVEALTRAGVPAGPVRSPWSARHDPQIAHRGALEALRHPEAEEDSPYAGPVLPVRMSRADLSTQPAEVLGASTRQVLSELLGVSDDELHALRAQGAIE